MEHPEYVTTEKILIRYVTVVNGKLYVFPDLEKFLQAPMLMTFSET